MPSDLFSKTSTGASLQVWLITTNILLHEFLEIALCVYTLTFLSQKCQSTMVIILINTLTFSTMRACAPVILP